MHVLQKENAFSWGQFYQIHYYNQDTIHCRCLSLFFFNSVALSQTIIWLEISVHNINTDEEYVDQESFDGNDETFTSDANNQEGYEGNDEANTSDANNHEWG